MHTRAGGGLRLRAVERGALCGFALGRILFSVAAGAGTEVRFVRTWVIQVGKFPTWAQFPAHGGRLR